MPAPLDFAACALLGTASAALVGRVFVQIQPGYTQPVQLWLSMTGDSGAKKTPTLNKFVGPLRKWLMEERAKEDPYFGKPSALENITTDATPEAIAAHMARHNGKAIIFTDEGSAMNVLTGMTYRKPGSESNIDALLQSYDGGLVSIARKLQDSSFDIPEAHLSMTVGMQPTILEKLSSNAELASRGFPQRLLYFLSEPMGHYVIKDLPKPDFELQDTWEKKVRQLATAFRDEKATLPMTDAAYEVFETFAQKMVDERFGALGGNEAIISWCLKAGGKVARLALILTLLENVDAVCVDAPAVEAAVALMNEYFIPHMKRVYCGDRQLTPEGQNLLSTMVFLAQSNGTDEVPQAAIKMRIRGQKAYKGTAGDMLFREKLRELSQAGMIRHIEAPSHQGAGRKGDGSWQIRGCLLGKPEVPEESTDETAPEMQRPEEDTSIIVKMLPGIPTDPMEQSYDPSLVDAELPF